MEFCIINHYKPFKTIQLWGSQLHINIFTKFPELGRARVWSLRDLQDDPANSMTSKHHWLVVFRHPSEKYESVGMIRNPKLRGKCQKWQPNQKNRSDLTQQNCGKEEVSSNRYLQILASTYYKYIRQNVEPRWVWKGLDIAPNCCSIKKRNQPRKNNCIDSFPELAEQHKVLIVPWTLPGFTSHMNLFIYYIRTKQ